MALLSCPDCSHQISTSAVSCPHCGRPMRSSPPALPISAHPKKRRSFVSSFLAIILLIGLAGMFANKCNQVLLTETSSTNLTSSAANPVSIKQQVREKFGIETWSWNKTPGGAFMEASFTITNSSSFDVKDITIRCQHSAKSGTKIDSNTRTIYDVIKAGQTKRFENFDMGFIHSQAVESVASIEDFVVVGR